MAKKSLFQFSVIVVGLNICGFLFQNCSPSVRLSGDSAGIEAHPLPLPQEVQSLSKLVKVHYKSFGGLRQSCGPQYTKIIMSRTYNVGGELNGVQERVEVFYSNGLCQGRRIVSLQVLDQIEYLVKAAQRIPGDPNGTHASWFDGDDQTLFLDFHAGITNKFAIQNFYDGYDVLKDSGELSKYFLVLSSNIEIHECKVTLDCPKQLLLGQLTVVR